MRELLALLAPVLAFVVAWGVTRACCRPGAWLYFLDQPNERSLHVTPTPRTGGVGVMAGLLMGGALVWVAGLGSLPLGAALAGAGGLALVGLADDRFSLSARSRLFVQVLVAGLYLAVLGPGGGALEVLLLGLGLVWMGNLYNFMDGSDGLAGGMALFGFSAYAVAAALGGQEGLALVCSAVAAAAAGFLVFNFHPARIFMGDAGSVPLGFLAGALGLAGREGGAWPLWFPLLVFAPFILDASVTLLRRALRGERVWQAHRTHYYQRLVQMGLGHGRTALLAYALMIMCGVPAVLALSRGFLLQCIVIILCVVVHLVLGRLIDGVWRSQHAEVPKS